MKSFRKVIATTALVVVGSMSVATMASAESINGSGATFPQSFQAAATVEYSRPHSKQKPQSITALQRVTPFRIPTLRVRVQARPRSLTRLNRTLQELTRQLNPRKKL